MKQFNTAGPVNRPDMYRVDPLTRWDMEEILSLIDRQRYFILHAPRQTGKTSCMLALRDYLNAEGKYFAIYTNVEVGQAARNNVEMAMGGIIGEVLSNVSILFNGDFDTVKAREYSKTLAPTECLSGILEYLSRLIGKPLVVFIDEIDALIGDTLVSTLRQLRAGYSKRPDHFPSSIILCGVRDIKDYRIHTSGQEIITGGSAFNIKTVSLRLGNFTKDDVINLYTQHTTESGQVFEKECFDLVMDYTDGQPWLVNALAYEVTWNIKENRNPAVTITPRMFEIAKERLILSRQTHLDQLADKLLEDRVRRIILPMILGEESQPIKDDIQYCIDLGLIKRDKCGLVVANQIYKEVIPRELTETKQEMLMSVFQPDWLNPDQSINIEKLLTMFRQYWIENGGMIAEDMIGYKEALPHIVMQAFLQRVVNGSGSIHREYGLARKRVDLFIKWKYGTKNKEQNIVIEIKTINKKQKYETIEAEAVIQTANYARICGVKEAYLVIFDKDNSQDWELDEAIVQRADNDVVVYIWKMTQMV